MCDATENIHISNCKYYLLSTFFLSHIRPSYPAFFQRVITEVEKGFNPLDIHIKPNLPGVFLSQVLTLIPFQSKR